MLTVEGLNQYYGSSHTLRDIAFELPASGCTTVLGRNGVGKTTLLKCLMGLLRPKAGRITMDGRDITGLRPEQRAKLGLAYVPQGREIFARLTVRENIEIAMAAVRPKARGIPAHVFTLFPVLREMLHRRGGDLSGGQQQQLAIARALVAEPRLLILDEPTEGIQPSIIKDIGRVIADLAKRSDMSVLLVEQYYEFARDLADRYLVLVRGEVVARGLGADLERDNVKAFLSV